MHDVAEFKEDGGNSTISRVVFSTNDQSGSSAHSETTVTGYVTEEMIHDIEKVKLNINRHSSWLLYLTLRI